MRRFTGLALTLFTLCCWMTAGSALAAAKPGVTWSVNYVDRNVSEDAGSATFTVTRSKSGGPATIAYTTADGTATAPSDFTATSGTLRFTSKQTSRTVTVPVVDDSVIETRVETFGLSISNPSKGVVGSPPANQDITDNDGTVSLTTTDWSPASVEVQDFSNGQGVTFKVANSGTREAVVNLSGDTGGYGLGGASAECTDDGFGLFHCTDVAVPAGSSTELQLTVNIPSCDDNEITITLDGLTDPVFGNANASPLLSHTITRTGFCS
jgi:hypothetical protein